MYADYKDQTNQTLVHILGSILRQLLTTLQVPVPVPVSDEVIQKLHEIQCQGKKVGTEDALTMLKILLHHLQHAFICIDAVDELEPKTRQQLLNILKELASNNTHIHLFLTGRGHIESEVQKRFQGTQEYTVIISASQQDIQEFVRQQIKEDHDLNPEAMDEGLAQSIIDGIIKKSQGM